MESEILCQLGKNVVQTEAKMINNLIDRIDKSFAQACQILHQCHGRIAVMGVGKSGHVGKKIAATLASTGSPAFFVHPSEAKHGDIGMLTENDVIIALSNSGETEEIICLLPVIKRLRISLIALTGNPTSALARSADVNLDVSVEKEACPLGLAPTSSTTAALVMGDALAMTLLEQRSFTEEDFARSHPGGNLGRKLLLKVDSIMHHGDSMPLITLKATLKDAVVEMTQKKLGMVTVINENQKLAGIFTDGDLRRAFDRQVDIHSTSITDLMTVNPKVISADMLATEALRLMENHKITALVIVNSQHQPLGVVHIHDILRAGIL